MVATTNSIEAAVDTFLQHEDSEIQRCTNNLIEIFPDCLLEKKWHLKDFCMAILEIGVLKINKKQRGLWNIIRNQIGNAIKEEGDFIFCLTDTDELFRYSYTLTLYSLITTILNPGWHCILTHPDEIPEQLLVVLLSKKGTRNYLYETICVNCCSRIDAYNLYFTKRLISFSTYRNIISDTYDIISTATRRRNLDNQIEVNFSKRRRVNSYIEIGSIKEALLIKRRPETNTVNNDIIFEGLRLQGRKILSLYKKLEKIDTCGLSFMDTDLNGDYSYQAKIEWVTLIAQIPETSRNWDKTTVCGKCHKNIESMIDIVNYAKRTEADFLSDTDATEEVINNSFWDLYKQYTRPMETPKKSFKHKWDLKCTMPATLTVVADIFKNCNMLGSSFDKCEKFLALKDNDQYVAYMFGNKDVSLTELTLTVKLIQNIYSQIWPFLDAVCTIKTPAAILFISRPELMMAYRMLTIVEALDKSPRSSCLPFNYGIVNVLLRNIFMDYNSSTFKRYIREISYYVLAKVMAYMLGSVNLMNYVAGAENDTIFSLYYQLPFVTSLWCDDILSLSDGINNMKHVDESIASFIALKADHSITIESLSILVNLTRTDRFKSLKDENIFVSVCVWGATELLKTQKNSKNGTLKLRKKSSKYPIAFDHIAVFKVITNRDICDPGVAREILNGIRNITQRSGSEVELHKTPYLKKTYLQKMNKKNSYVSPKFWSRSEFSTRIGDLYPCVDRICEIKGKENEKSLVEHYDKINHASGFHRAAVNTRDKSETISLMETFSRYLQWCESSNIFESYQNIDEEKVTPVILKQLLVQDENSRLPLSSDPELFFEDSLLVLNCNLNRDTKTMDMYDFIMQYHDIDIHKTQTSVDNSGRIKYLPQQICKYSTD